MERIEISLEKLFDSIRQKVENVGNYDSYSEILTISSHQKAEFGDVLNQSVEEFLNTELEEETQEETLDFMDEDVFLLSEDEDDDEDDDEEY
ncbi:hypothetical protein [Priestia megaterium]|uniref:hypothetical protein n=1 Tax=Priestia megaterium TaxID=1404 RepID=UPI003100CD6E